MIKSIMSTTLLSNNNEASISLLKYRVSVYTLRGCHTTVETPFWTRFRG